MIRAEFVKQTLRVRTYVLLGLVAAFPVLLTVIFRVFDPAPHGGPGGDFTGLATNSGLNMTLAVLGHLSDLVLPIAGAVIAGSAVAEEAGWGTLGYLLVRPVPRGRLLASKLAVVAALMLAATLFAILFAAFSGIVSFGWAPVAVPSGGTLPSGTALARLAVATPYLAWSLAGLISFGFLVSAIANSPLYAAAAAFGLAVISRTLDSLSFLGDVRSALPTHYWRAWEGLFAASADWGDLLAGAAVQLPYVIVFLGLAWWLFSRRDIVT